MINFKVIFKVLGVLLIIIGLLMLSTIPFSLYYGEDDFYAFLISSSISIGIGLFFWLLLGKNAKESIRKRDGYLIVSLGWLSMSVFGCLPFLFSGTIPEVENAFFETISGFTTTGASVLNDIESLPHGILFCRSMTQWIGGMGIIVMAVAILPLLGIGGMELFIAEAPGPTSDKIHPRIKETAKRLWGIYVILSGILTILLKLGGMSFFDAINHAITTMATGGYSTKQASIAHFDSAFIHYTIIVFMFIAGMNYTVLYFGLKGKFSRLWNNDEFKTYFITCIGVSILVAIILAAKLDYGIERAFRDSLFQVVSIITTTGFATADFTRWAPFLTLIFFILMFTGASAGSTSGGIKIIRHFAMAKNCFLEFRRLIHPRAIIPLKINKKVVKPEIISNILVFNLLYVIIFIVGSIIMSLFNLDFESSVGAVATTLGNVGPGIGSLGPSYTFSEIPALGKWFLSFLMLLGRLELFTILILFTGYFWREK